MILNKKLENYWLILLSLPSWECGLKSERIAVGKSLSKHELVAGFEKNSDAAIAYKKLAQEVLAK